jgi:hypothetical protein
MPRRFVRSGFKAPSKAPMAALPRKRDSHLILWNRVQHRPPINAHIPMYAARYRSACALPLNLI